jgi:hypothetical protein
MVSPRVETRLVQWMILIGSLGALGIGLAGKLRFAGGFVVGAGIAILGFIWLEAAVGRALSSAAGSGARDEKTGTKGLVLKLVLRYPMLFGVVYLFYRTNWLPFWAVFAGLLVPLAGAMVESAYQLAMVLSS